MNKLITLLAVALLAAGCSSAASQVTAHPSSSAAAEPGVSTYLCSGSTNDTLLQFRDSDGVLSGTYQFAQLSGQTPSEQVSSNSGGLSGTLNGTALTVSIGLSQALYGTLSGSQLSLNVPQSDGTIQAATCNRAAISDWNNAVRSLTSQASTNNSTASQAQASASAAAAQQQKISSDESTANTALTTLQNDTGSLGTDVSSLNGDAQTANNDLGTTRSDAIQGQGYDCENVQDTVYNDAVTTLYNDQVTSLANDVATLQQDISTVRGDIGTLNGDISALSGDGQPAPSDSSAAVSAANSAIASAISNANGDIATVNSDVRQGYSVANSIATGNCAGDGPGNPPPPEQTIS